MAAAKPCFAPGRAEMPTTKLELSISCRNLIDADTFSKSDPMCVMYMKDSLNGKYREFGRTETIRDCLNPDFVTKFVVDYYFEEQQLLKFVVYDIDSTSQNLEHHDYLGELECSLAEIVSNQGVQFKRKLKGKTTSTKFRDCGFIIIVAEELSSCKDIITLQFRAINLDKKDFFGKSDPFLTFSRSNEDSRLLLVKDSLNLTSCVSDHAKFSFTVVHKTEVLMKTLNPTWKPFTLPLRRLCNGDYNRTIRMQCYDWNRSGSHSLIGEFPTNITRLMEGPGSKNEYELINERKQKKKKKYKNSGVIILMSCSIEEEYSFVDYLKGGTRLHFAVAIDFTASNGDPRSPQSLHYIFPLRPNMYATAIQAAGEILQDYNRNKLFLALGFGARLPPDGRISHDFFLNGNTTNPFCQGIDGILEAYNRTLNSVQLYGPTNFAPVINHVARYARTSRCGNDYYILMIITDGIITDMPETRKAIVDASTLPFSIIIVGVGNADFTAMEILDGDHIRLSSRGVYAARDIVQFVPFNDFLSSGSWFRKKVQLAKEVMAEVPEQLVSYMKSHRIQPRKPRPGTVDDITITPSAPPSTAAKKTTDESTSASIEPPPPTYNDALHSPRRIIL